MVLDLPDVIAEYFRADRQGDAEAVADCFADSAVVKDEGEARHGRDAIRQWKKEASAKYSYVATPLTVATEGDRTVVTSRLAGDFPGSPLNLRYVFVLHAGKIAELEIGL